MPGGWCPKCHRGDERARPPVHCYLGCVTQVTMRRQSVTPVTSPRDSDSSHSLPCVSPGPQSLSSQIVFGSDSLRPSASFDSLGTLYDARWAPKMRPPFFGAKVSRRLELRCQINPTFEMIYF